MLNMSKKIVILENLAVQALAKNAAKINYLQSHQNEETIFQLRQNSTSTT